MAIQYYADQDVKGTLTVAGASTFANAATIQYAVSGASPLLSLFNSTNLGGATIRFSDQVSLSQNGEITYRHQDSLSYGSGNAFILTGDQSTMTILADGKLMYKEGVYLKPATGTGAGTRKDNLWDSSYTITSAFTTIGKNFTVIPDVTAVSYTRINADETISLLSASQFRSAIGAGTGTGDGNVTTGGFTSGRIPFANSTVNLDNSANLLWNNTTPKLNVRGGTTSLTNQPCIPLLIDNSGGVDGRVMIQIKTNDVSTASAQGAGITLTAPQNTTGTYDPVNSLIFLQTKSPGNQTIHSAPQNIKFHVDNDGTGAGAGTDYNAFGDLAFELFSTGIAKAYYEFQVAGNLNCINGQIELGGTTGRIQGVDTVTAGTDAANKDYVDAKAAGESTWPNVGAGSRTNYTLGFTQTAAQGQYAGFYFEKTAGSSDAGYFLLRGGADNGVYKQGGITLVGDSGTLTLATRTSASNVLRFMTGATSVERLNITGTGAFSFGNSVTNYGTSGQVMTSNGNATPGWTTISTGVQSVASGDTDTITIAGTATNPTVAANTGTVSLTSDNLATGTQIQTAINTATTGALKFISEWSAAGTAGGSPDLRATGTHLPGNYYIVSVAGSATPNGAGTTPDDWAVGDWCIRADLATDTWQKIDNTQVGNVTGSGSSGRVAYWNSDSNITSDADLTFDGTNLTVGGNITLSGSGARSIQSGGDIALKTSTGEYALYGAANGNTNLYYNGLQKFRTGSTGVVVTGDATISTVLNATGDPDKFLCINGSGTVQYRTGSQVLSDIGGAPVTGGSYLPLAGGTMTGPIDFNGTAGDHGEFEWTSGNGTTGDVWSLGFYQNSAFRASMEFFASTEAAADGNIRFKSGNITTLTLDSSQDATFAGKVILPAEESSDYKLVFEGAAATSGFSTVDEAGGAALYMGANSIINQSGAVVTKNTLLPSMGINLEGFSQDFIGFYTSLTGNPAQRMAISSIGAIKFNNYNSTNNVGTPTYLLGTDASGNIVKTNTVPGSGAGPYLPLSAGSSYPLSGPLYITSDGSAAHGAEIYLKHANNNSTDTIGTLFFGNNADATLSSIVVETNGANNTSNLKLNTSNAGTMSTALTLQGDNDAIFTGNVGIGTTIPGEKLEVEGNIKLSSIGTGNNANSYGMLFYGTTSSGTQTDQAKIHSSPWVSNSNGGNLQLYTSNASNAITERMRIDGAGNVGIGTTSPNANAKLHLYNSASATDVALRLTSNANSKTLIGFGDTVDQTAGAIKYDNATSEMSFEVLNSTEAMRINSSGNVGIGTEDPGQKLQVEFANSDTSFSGGSGGDWGSEGIRIENTINTVDTMAMLHFRNNDADIHIAGIRQGGNDSDLGFFFEGDEKVRFTNNGNVGIGTTTPDYKFEVQGVISSADASLQKATFANVGNDLVLTANADATNVTAKILFNSSGAGGGTVSTKMIIDGSGKVGIGTVSPDHLLDLYKSTGTTSSNTGTTLQRLWNYVGADLNQQKTFIDFVFQDDNVNQYPQVRIGAELGQNGDANTTEKEGSGAFVVYTNNAPNSTPGTNSLTERFRVDYKGDVGIGNISPNYKLDVTGDIFSTGQMFTKGSDFVSFTVSGDLDTGLGNFDKAGQVSLVSNGKAEITVDNGTIAFDNYTATAVATTGSLIPNQSNQAVTADTLANLCVDPGGNVVRGSQEGTWTFTKAQLDALATTTSGGTQLIQAPGANKAVIVEESNWMVKYSGTGSMSQNSFEIRQSTVVLADAGISRIPFGQINNIMNSAQGTPTNPSYGFYARDLPQYNNDGRTYKTNAQTVLMRINTNATPANLISISIKLKYRLFDAATF